MPRPRARASDCTGHRSAAVLGTPRGLGTSLLRVAAPGLETRSWRGQVGQGCEREPQGALTHTRTPTFAHTRACTRTRGARSPRRVRRGPRMLPPPRSGPGGLGRVREAVTGPSAPSRPRTPAVLVCTRRLRGDRARRPRHHFIPGRPAAGGGGAAAVGGDAGRQAAPWRTCAQPTGRSGAPPSHPAWGPAAP